MTITFISTKGSKTYEASYILENENINKKYLERIIKNLRHAIDEAFKDKIEEGIVIIWEKAIVQSFEQTTPKTLLDALNKKNNFKRV